MPKRRVFTIEVEFTRVLSGDTTVLTKTFPDITLFEGYCQGLEDMAEHSGGFYKVLHQGWVLVDQEANHA